MKKALFGGTVALVALCLATVHAASPAVERALTSFWAARTPADATKAADAVVAANPTFAEALAALKAGKKYATDVPRGVVKQAHTVNGVEFAYTLDVPTTYDPAKQYQVRIQLHGGVGRPDAAPRGNGIGALAGTEQIYILPTAWSEAEWWTDAQLENLRFVLDHVKRTYNVDENHVVLSGVSDGGTGTYYFSMRDTTPFAAFLPLNGAIAVLKNSTLRRDGEMYPNNFVNKPFFIVNGGRDPLYPTSDVEPYINQMTKTGVTVKYLPQPNAVHNTAWWPEVKGTYEQFVTEHPRQPHPEKVTWQTDMTAGTTRAHWVVVDALAKGELETAALPDVNDILIGNEPNFGIRATGLTVTAVTAGSNAASFGFMPGDVITKIGERTLPPIDVLDLLPVYDAGTKLTFTVRRDGTMKELSGTYAPVATPRVSPMFYNTKPSGRVDAVRAGNTITLQTRRVAAATLLISPDVFDLSKPITVVANGKEVFNGRVTPSVKTLMKWAARDNDRTMLYAAEIAVKP